LKGKSFFKKFKLTYELKINKKNQENKDQFFKIIKNQEYGFKDEIENKLKFNKKAKN